MIGIEQLKTEVGKIEQARSKADALAAELAEKISKLQDGTRTPEFVQTETTKLRNIYAPVIEKAVGEAGSSASLLELADRQWKNTDFILSRRAVSPRANDHQAAPPKDATAEAMTRLMLMQQFSHMNDELLRLTADEAKATGQHGQLYFINAELVGRGQQGVDLSDVILDDQRQALDLLRRADAGKHGALLALRSAGSGRPVSPMDRMNQARMDGVTE